MSPVRRLLVMLFVLLVAAPAFAQAPCVLVDNGSGTVDLPPAGCGYLSPTDVHELIDAANFPPGTVIEMDIDHRDFFCSQGGGPVTPPPPACSTVVDPATCEGPGPTSTTVVECFESVAEITLTGKGILLGYVETLTVPLFTEVLAERDPLNPTPPLSFATTMSVISGSLPFGASLNICQLDIIGGADVTPGLNDGQVTLTPTGTGEFTLVSHFNIDYQVFWQGCPGGALAGFSGPNPLQTVRMEAFGISTRAPSVGFMGATALVALLILGWRYGRGRAES